MKITNRIPFTLADYESGKYRVVTRNNCDARIICKDCIPYKGNEKLLGTDNNPLL